MRFKKRCLSFNEYVDLVSVVKRGWHSAGMRWLEEKFGECYRGHLGLLGNALLAAYAQDSCLDAVLEPVISIGGRLEVSADVAMQLTNGLLVLEVKVHHRGEADLKSQLDSVAENYGLALRKDHKVYLAVMHMFTHRRPPAIRTPEWVQLFHLPPNQRLAMKGLADALGNLCRKLGLALA